MKSIPIPSKYENVQSMFKACTGHVPVKNEATTAPQSLHSVKQTERVDVRVGQIL